jgi:hypothetical protein
MDERRRDLQEKREFAADGSPIYRYGRDTTVTPRLGFSDEPTAEYVERREALYTELFGPIETVSHEVMPFVPHIDVYVHAPGYDGRDFYTLITGGMSDIPMTVPAEAGDQARRAELILYCAEPKPEYVAFLRFLAHFPHDNGTWLGVGHTMPNGDPPSPFFSGSDLTSLILIDSILAPDRSFAERLTLGGDPVDLLWVVPLTTAECELKLQHGLDALYGVLNQHNHPFILDESRSSYV